jgi:hypothetical protein
MGKLNTLIDYRARICAIVLMLIASPSSSANAEQPPRTGCVAVSKQEYDSAKKQKLLHSRFSTYVRTGRLGKRHYWYCRS